MLGKPNVETRYQEELDAFIGEVQARLRLENQLHRAAELMPSEEAKRLLHEALRDALSAGVASQGAINNLGYEYFNDGALDMAMAVFEFNVRAFPDAANPHDSYGEALEKAGRLEEAEKAYARAVELSDPSSRDYNTFLENLRRVREKGGR
jgi:tetratricopeptide (TPR) repeat protein